MRTVSSRVMPASGDVQPAGGLHELPPGPIGGRVLVARHGAGQEPVEVAGEHGGVGVDVVGLDLRTPSPQLTRARATRLRGRRP